MIPTIKFCRDFLKFACAVAVIVFVGMVFFHDDGIPDSLTEAEKTHVLKVASEMDDKLGEIIQRFENLLANPDQESQMIDELVIALDEHYPNVVEAATNPVFFLSCIETREIEERIAQKYRQLDETCAIAITEIARRQKLGEGDLGYNLLASQLKKMGNVKGGPCHRRQCFWCRCKHGSWL